MPKKKEFVKTVAKKAPKAARNAVKNAAKKVPNGPPNSYSYVNRALRCALSEMGRDPDEAPGILEKVYRAFYNAIEDGYAITSYRYDASGNLEVVDPQKHKGRMI